MTPQLRHKIWALHCCQVQTLGIWQDQFHMVPTNRETKKQEYLVLNRFSFIVCIQLALWCTQLLWFCINSLALEKMSLMNTKISRQDKQACNWHSSHARACTSLISHVVDPLGQPVELWICSASFAAPPKAIKNLECHRFASSDVEVCASTCFATSEQQWWGYQTELATTWSCNAIVMTTTTSHHCKRGREEINKHVGFGESRNLWFSRRFTKTVALARKADEDLEASIVVSSSHSIN